MHDVAFSVMQGTHVHIKWLEERAKARKAKRVPWISDSEKDTVALVDERDDVFRCKLCNTVLSKVSCLKHMVRKHKKDRQSVLRWITVSDGWVRLQIDPHRLPV